jgi:carbonic anhydrase
MKSQTTQRPEGTAIDTHATGADATGQGGGLAFLTLRDAPILPGMKKLSRLFEQNKAWAEAITGRDPQFFPKLSRQQNPEYLWIGCADSRVPANEIVGLLPGEVFVHRNIANVVVHADLNALSVIQYAVDVLQVKHIMVVGHYGCGGVQAAYACTRVGLADNWLRHVQDVRNKHEQCLHFLPDDTARSARLCELNVIEQAVNVCQTTIVQDAWARGQELTVHGWIYGLRDGLLRDLQMTASSAEEVTAAQRNAVALLST